MTTQRDPEKGWGWPVNSRKAHYFDNSSKSLCMRWMYFGALYDDQHGSPDNCAECYRKMARRRTLERRQTR